jgi:hypothetical protein
LISDQETLLLLRADQQYPCSWDKILKCVRDNRHTVPDDAKQLDVYYTITYVLHHSVGDFVIPSSFLSFTDSLVIPSSFLSFTDSLVIPSSFPSFTDNLDFSCLIVAVSSSCLASSGTVCLLSLTHFRILSQEHGCQ